MYNPVSTYRIQFNREFTFSDFRNNVEYFRLLGISAIYASPIFAASPGSMHGYDVTDPLRINPEIGTYSQFSEISELLHSLGVGWIQDIVPNHMAFSQGNPWLMDVLEKGQSSEYANYFDIDFSHPDSEGKIIIPFLGKDAQQAIEDKELSAEWNQGNFVFRYFGYIFPFSPESFKFAVERSGKSHSGYTEIIRNMDFENFTDDDWTEFRKNAYVLYEQPVFRNFIQHTLDIINSDPVLIKELLSLQNYKLVKWTSSSSVLNYRRFFTVNSLISLRMENDEVFSRYHRFIAEEVNSNRIDGLRIDHIDGLKKPLKYVENLRLLTGGEKYIVAEKILGSRELMPFDTPLQGTSGYDFLGIVNSLLTYKKNYADLGSFYRKIAGVKGDLKDLIYRKKKFILTKKMGGEWENLIRLLEESNLVVYDEYITRDSMKNAIGEFLVLFPVYKFYSDAFPLTREESRSISSVLSRAVEKEPALEQSLIALGNLFLYQEGLNERQKERALDFYLRCMQFTGPLMAKGVEDTVMYNYNLHIGHNDVGDDPGSEGITVDEYHRMMQDRQRNWPMTMNATSTHDTKRGEDVRARLNILTEMSEEWKKNVRKWKEVNAGLKIEAGEKNAPDDNEEYFIYQTLIGVFPFGGVIDDNFLTRVDEYLLKSLREAKTNTDWDNPDENYEKAVISFTRNILKTGSDFLNTFIPFQKKVSDFGVVNSLTQLMLKATSPGIPDFYQGTELWDLSMVDPDNRRPVNYEERFSQLMKLSYREEIPENLYEDLFLTRNDGRIKLFLTWQLIAERNADPELFTYGKYIPLQVKGRYAEHIISYARVYRNRWFVVIAPLYFSAIPGNRDMQEPGLTEWEDTAVILPDTAPLIWSTSAGAEGLAPEGAVLISDVLKAPCPVFLKSAKESRTRAAGVLAHISSLPGKYGTGDLGLEAYDFADKLQESGQSYWQILPFNPVSEGLAWSPYSSASAFAGNPIFISPDLLVRSRLITEEASQEINFRETYNSDLALADQLRGRLLSLASEVFTKSDRPWQKKLFNDFCEKQKYWLDDYALFSVLKKENNGKPWYEWPDALMHRNSKSLLNVRLRYEEQIITIKLAQYLFQKQWLALKDYCNVNGIRIIGDVSFYVNYDSADMWAHHELFKLDADMKPLFVAGVPPDFFSETGQLWNMPVYNWDKMRKTGFDWWLSRIRRNLELCDIIRLDHFRGFSEYWEVPSGETTSVNGQWVEGPGRKFFDRVEKEFPSMPFIAEDLGDIDDKVYRLRDHFSLPGMVVLQFAFGNQTPSSPYIPHNYSRNCLVYTGTHDNNTTIGWFKNELEPDARRVAEEYLGHSIDPGSSNEDFIRLAYSSVAKVAIIPVQDILGLDEAARLNKPSTAENNWKWKMKKSDYQNSFFSRLRQMAVLFGRI